ncbi:hypothetical protein L486_04737 [Kwoniella mangroviensis CBS 10435]|uniref:Uncharacterized protein n=1 Tax=Kwoniella mangroviensis CBS 10435 TaxID=1331196 RepID=A0A1B9IP93_9TREE|nr:uncharacterized protein I203_00522 [Kwoniella mangroviensis CBS 8507]OCF57281.1 hypothetical protein L486_04737 [Kwoniella mangroviensis CBS 10435]OCF70388.1 hypothetical protein I203_00522 [Kwoniella mangroviensis CBS 8507]OCF76164.1 hypothetical protein I204_03463 [Kwoniella mangroviensis CBS 8886]
MSPSCKLCHGPLASTPAANEVHCHANCLPFACPGCVKSNKPSYTIINLKNHIYDYQCSECMAENENHQGKLTTGVLKAHTTSDGHAIY